MSNPCPRCERLPTPPTGSGRLWLWPPLGHSLGKISRHLAATGHAATTRGANGWLSVDLTADTITPVVTGLAEALDSAEAEATRALYKTGFDVPDLGEIGEISSLAALAARLNAGWLVDLLAQSRLTTHFQPIFAAADPARVVAHECLLRGLEADGAIIPPGRLFGAAGAADLLFQLDRAARTTAIHTARQAGVDSLLFINFTPSAIYDPANCLRTTLAVIEETGFPRDRIVFEVVESERIRDSNHLAGVLDWYREAGFRVALDDVGAGFASLNLLPALKPDFIKIDRELIEGVADDGFRGAIVGHLIGLAHDLGLQVVAEGLERPEDLAWLQAAGADLVQGFLLALPGPEPVGAT